MPIHLLPLLIVGGLVSAAAKGAAMIAESDVKEVNQELDAAEARAYEKNRQYAGRRLAYKQELEGILAEATARFSAFLAKHSLAAKEIAGWKPEPWLRERMGELVIRRPLMIEPQFDQPANMQQIFAGFRVYQSGASLARTNAVWGQNVQGLALIGTAGAYVTQQVDLTVEAKKFVAAARAYLFALNKTIEGFDARFARELYEDQWSVYRARLVLYEFDTAVEFAESENGIRCRAIVQQHLIELLQGLIGRYSS
jgi:hypothetical protein